MSSRTKRAFLGRSIVLLALIVGVASVFFLPRIPQSEEYHNFADKRSFFGIPNTFDVLSNGAFVFAGLHGLLVLMGRKNRESMFQNDAEAQTYFLIFLSMLLIAAGSSYYHWNPTTETLFWDRLPMTLAFMSLFSVLITERVHAQIGRQILIPLLALGIFSVFYWRYTEVIGNGDLRCYIVVQFLPIIATPFIILLHHSRYTHGHDFLFGLLLYVLAKVTEVLDVEIFHLTFNTVSGHTLKHLLAAAGIECLAIMLQTRKVNNTEKKTT